MADQRSLGFIGLGFGAITAVVMLVAVLVVVAQAGRVPAEDAPIIARASTAT